MRTYYTYLSYEEFEGGRMYIGQRKCPEGKTPETDPYLGSYTDKTFKPTAKFIIGRYGSREDALRAEIKLHKDNNVSKNPLFANKACATSTGFFCNHFTDEHRKKISQSLMGRKISDAHKKIISQSNSKRKDWYHPDHGEVLNRSVTELINMFPDQKLKRSFLCKVSNEKKFHYRGWKLLKNREEKFRHNRCISRDWYHPIHGEILQRSCSELIKMFPEQNLNRGHLVQVALKKEIKHKNWRLLENKDVKGGDGKSKPINWFNPIYGVILQKSCTELIKMFPEQALNRQNLNSVARGKRKHHKNWRLYSGY